MKLILTFVTSGVLLAGCMTTQQTTGIPCELMPQQNYSRNDTVQTREEIIVRNAIIAELCPAA